MADIGQILGGAGSGAAAGSSFGPIGAGIGAGLGALGGALGGSGEDDAKKIAKLQIAAQERALAQFRSDLDPFRNILSQDQISQQASLATDPTSQLNFLQGNPLFAKLMEQSQNQLFANQAASGKLAGGGTQAALQDRFLAGGGQFVDQQLNRVNPLLTIGANAAAGTAAGSANILGNIGDIGAAGLVAQGNARAASSDALFGGLSAAAGALGNRPTSFFSQPSFNEFEGLGELNDGSRRLV